jgi:hypothetical protein
MEDSDVTKAIGWIKANLTPGLSKDVKFNLYNRLKQLDTKLFLSGVVLTYFDYETYNKWTRTTKRDYSVKLVSSFVR